jgi:hypothetical protein
LVEPIDESDVFVRHASCGARAAPSLTRIISTFASSYPVLTIKILRWDKTRAWTDWGGRLKTDLAGSIQAACPSLRLTERKRLARMLAAGGVTDIVVENPKYAESLSHILEATGAVVSMSNVESNQSSDPVLASGTTRAGHEPRHR